MSEESKPKTLELFELNSKISERTLSCNNCGEEHLMVGFEDIPGGWNVFMECDVCGKEYELGEIMASEISSKDELKPISKSMARNVLE